MTILSYEPFIRICQRCLINIDGTVAHSSNQACPLLSFFLHLLLAHHHSLLPPCAYFLHHFSRSLPSLFPNNHPYPHLQYRYTSNKEQTVPLLLPPLFFLDPTNTCILAPHPTPLRYPYLFLTLSLYHLTPVTHPLSRLFPLLTCTFAVVSRFAFLCR